MFATIALSARPAFVGAGRVMSPIIKEAAHDAAVGVAAVAFVTAGTAIAGATAIGLEVMGRAIGRKTMDLVRHMPRLHVELVWDDSWTADSAAATEYRSWQHEPAPGTDSAVFRPVDPGTGGTDGAHAPLDPTIAPGARPDGGGTATA